ncbi:MAG: hypothetical protein K2Y32_16230 [Candidatus Obscuribacterales bacterium]|nr:hypothetical protein [Candidatus Obscuribacterales bacterium]
MTISRNQSEYAVLTLFIAIMVSIIMGLALFWAGVVSIVAGGLTLFALVLKTGWSQAEVDSLGPLTVGNACGLWLWSALVVYFGIVSLPHWPWFVFLTVVLLSLVMSIKVKL